MHHANLLAAFSLVIAPTAVLADTKSYRVDAYSDTTIEISVCSDAVDVVADGDDDTDLDFWIYDQAGTLVTSDTDTTDLMYATLNRGSDSGCTSYNMQVSNLGEVYNQFEVTLITSDEGGSSRTYRVDAYDTYQMDLSVCSPSLDIRVNGDDDTDLDFYLYDPQGNEVFSDTDTTDLMIYTLVSKAKAEGCLPYRLEIVNLGEVYNQFEVALLAD